MIVGSLKEMSMRTVFAAVIGIVALGISSLTAAAGSKECKPGQEYDEAKGKCVIIRGS